MTAVRVQRFCVWVMPEGGYIFSTHFDRHSGAWNDCAK
jgi:hypothetical protein